MKRLRPSRGSRSKPRTTRAKYDCLDVLTGDEARTVLHELLSSRPDLIPDARRAANALLARVSFADVAADVFAALQALDLDDLDAGPRPGGYVEPSEAAWEVIEKVVTPYFHDLKRRVKLGHEDEAVELCKGIVVGLYRAEHRGFELLEYAMKRVGFKHWTGRGLCCPCVVPATYSIILSNGYAFVGDFVRGSVSIQ